MKCIRCGKELCTGDANTLCRECDIHVARCAEKATERYRKTRDNVNHPAHYTAGGVECIDALKAATVNLTRIEAVCTANAIKCLWRWKGKNGAEDLKKAAWYINKLIAELDDNKTDDSVFLMSNGREK